MAAQKEGREEIPALFIWLAALPGDMGARPAFRKENKKEVINF